jgi:antitoxin (DNA-binding transcriptional repressor) of toxin-antitoxin stability system
MGSTSTINGNERNAEQLDPMAVNRVVRTDSVTVGELKANFKAVEAKLAEGARVQVTRRGAVVAEMVAPTNLVVDARSFADRMPEFLERLKSVWGPVPLDIDTTAMVLEGRDRDYMPR